ncbi:hypothetical protein B0W48_07335 [Pseudoalteromonas aliena]|uniref:Shedu protein SduA C-terminal domain-containing protein n=1 Tax=Pseudoalteromonas aliena TaxID=247523 RepID=A0A1Q2GWV9_9GAMM|nr:Shedu anti-phage system protein SduA domain-containing protein [Pseudoalteromonas aliena]AQP99628.1 hypothetical protein B0W48_07335 [Pseudoalteromonas aliena]
MPMEKAEKLYAWKNFNRSPIKKQILDKWMQLLGDKSLKEQAYQVFLRNHAGMFIPQGGPTFREQLVLEKIRLGGDYITDFISVDSDRSDGFKFTLIEIESPHSNLFTNEGLCSNRLQKALKQVEDWQHWIQDNKDTASRILPTEDLLYSVEYLIIIGRREEDKDLRRSKLKLLERQKNVKIRSFDHLTDVFLSRSYDSYTKISKSSGETVSKEQNNQFTNPFYIAYPDKEWRSMTNKFKKSLFHMVSRNIEVILEHRSYNTILPDYEKWACINGNNEFCSVDDQFILNSR